MRRPANSPAMRSGFTLLEVLLASAIAALLMAGLYFAMDIQFRQVREGRDRVEQATLIRNVTQRITSDLSACLTPIAAAASGSSESSGDSSSTDAAAAALMALTDTGTAGGDLPFAVGLVGDSSYVTVFVSRVPNLESGNPDNPDAALPGDVRRVSYWLTSAAEGGLARQEEVWLTSESLRNNFDPDFASELDRIMAPEVTSASFEYYDGTDWVDSWDGSTPGDDGVTPMGPPRAIAVTLTFQFPSSPLSATATPTTKTIRHVIVLPTAPGTAAPAASESGSGTTEGSSGTGGSGTGTTP
ncbi:prepilin-type N-terminal cleavage/methylation domain-containing protein [Tuwongella immobilis]|uniref:Type II secretion system protein J n=1 Tax=Tuwongella immobilis TaxID=692036 RepID=A0A6C2YSG6_9BACT|nr:prepilin-type N-terminal cleavage/methylation domain-containing protein [Tuwongella immobilis]VIP04406.1 Uncharacterized protein OS=Planctomyces maris DSM 8797 GN=PM8797T_14299 PE=4 SV=1: T2SJ [Tuwongella immobilis]VTS06174.1 Uncharacterized protein OS=Planctomyces maris DSM 8797 GN=PM8797T_14299 PE=4 SV=1: T2SJ [Tuwongella immobilis]